VSRAPSDATLEEHYREVSKMCFEYFKHLATLSIAAALVEITLYQQVGIDLVTLISSLITQGLVLLVSLGGWLLCLCEAEYRGSFCKVPPLPGYKLLYYWQRFSSS
jgi:hypothetical protein